MAILKVCNGLTGVQTNISRLLCGSVHGSCMNTIVLIERVSTECQSNFAFALV